MNTVHDKATIDRFRAAAALGALLAVCCGTDFEDGAMSELKKLELLSIVLEPPEAGPGDMVTASFLLADGRGVIESPSQFWLPAFELQEEGGRRRTGTGSAAFDPGRDTAELMLPELSLVVGSRSQYDFDGQGFAEHVLGLLAFVGEAPDLEAMAGGMGPEQLDKLLDSEQVKLGIRTLVVSDREDKNRNPRVTGIGWGPDEEAEPEPVQMFTCFDGDRAGLRQQAADHPLEVEEEQSVYFSVQVEDDDPIDEAIRYQWISTGGDFGGFRERVQRWEAPAYREPGPEKGEEDQREQGDVDPRIDPNLHPIWMIVRDSGVSGHLGQSWAELYVRVIPSAGQ